MVKNIGKSGQKWKKFAYFSNYHMVREPVCTCQHIHSIELEKMNKTYTDRLYRKIWRNQRKRRKNGEKQERHCEKSLSLEKQKRAKYTREKQQQQQLKSSRTRENRQKHVAHRVYHQTTYKMVGYTILTCWIEWK